MVTFVDGKPTTSPKMLAPGNHRLTDRRIGFLLAHQHALEFDIRTNLDVAIIDLDDIAFLHPILASAVFENYVHEIATLLRALAVGISRTTNIGRVQVGVHSAC